MSEGSGEAVADAVQALLAEGYEPEDITALPILVRLMRAHIDQAVRFELSAGNIDRPRAETPTGATWPGRGEYHPSWYVAQGIQTGFNEGLYGVLREALDFLAPKEASR